MTPTLEEIWPPYGLVIDAGDLRFTALREADVPEVLAVVADGIHPPERMPFLFPWTDAPPEQLGPNYMRFFASTLLGTDGRDAALELVVRRRGEVVGMQALNGRDLPVTRRMETGSWLGMRFQGEGLGTLMRRVMCAFAFDHLGLDAVHSSAWEDNEASRRVSEKVGYRETCRGESERRGVSTPEVFLELRAQDFQRGPMPELRVRGAGPLREFLGLAERAPTRAPATDAG